MPTKVEISLSAEQYRKDLETVIGETRQAAARMSADLTAGTGQTGPTIAVTAEVSGKEEVEKFAEAVEEIPAEKAVEVKVGKTDVPKLEWVQDAPDKTIQVKVDAQTDKVKELRTDIGKLPAKKTVTIPVETFGDKLKKTWSDLRRELNDLNGGAKKLISTVLGTGGGAIGIFAAGLASLWKIMGTYFEHQTAKMKDAAQAHVEMASAIGEAAANNERLKASSNEVISQLSQLANVEKLSNAQKTQAIALIAQLTRQYGDLGVTVNEATGRIEGLSAAIVKKQEKDARRKISSLEGEIKELRSANSQENENISNAGFNVGKLVKGASWFGSAGVIANLTGLTEKFNSATGLDQVQIGGEADAKEAAGNIKKNTAEITKKQLELAEQRKRLAEIEKKQLLDVQVETAALEAQRVEREKQSVYTKADNELHRARTAEEKIANRQALIAGEKAQNDELHRKTEAAKARMDQAAPGSLQYEDAKKAYLQNLAEQAKSDERIAGWNEQIRQIQHEQAEAKRKLVEQSSFELTYQKLIAAGEYDKAAALKQEYDLKQQNLKLSDEEKKRLLDQQKELKQISAQKELQTGEEELRIQRLILAGEYEKAQVLKLQAEARKQGRNLSEAELKLRLKQKQDAASLSLAGSTRDKAQDLAWSAMEKAGLGRQAAEQRALRDAEKTKGGKLTDSETDAVRKLTELTWNLNHQRDAQFGDLSVKTNSLTARGGFQGGAAAPDVDKYQRAVAETSKSMLQYVQRIETFCRDIGKGGTF